MFRSLVIGAGALLLLTILAQANADVPYALHSSTTPPEPDQTVDAMTTVSDQPLAGDH
jgi:hypothetical protein